MTKKECAIVMAYTGVCMLVGDDLKYFYDYVSTLMDKPLLSHEIGERADLIKEAAKDDFFELCKTATYDETENELTIEDSESPDTYIEKNYCEECCNYNKTTSICGWCCVMKDTVTATSEANFACGDRFKKREA